MYKYYFDYDFQTIHYLLITSFFLSLHIYSCTISIQYTNVHNQANYKKFKRKKISFVQTYSSGNCIIVLLLSGILKKKNHINVIHFVLYFENQL